MSSSSTLSTNKLYRRMFMLGTVYKKVCPQCKDEKLFEKFNGKLCGVCYRENRRQTMTCVDCGAEKGVIFPSKAQRLAYRCQPCGSSHGILQSFADPIKRKAWADRTDGKAMRAAVKNPYLPTSGESHPTWKGGIPPCTHCGTTDKSREAKACQPCAIKHWPKGEDAYNWVGGDRECLDCGKHLKKQQTLRCVSCSVAFRQGEHHHHWQGGKTSQARKERGSQAVRRWSKAVRDRDDNTCQLCQTKQGKLDAHHIKRWADHPELRLDVDNGKTLCRTCHFTIVHQGYWHAVPLDFWS